MDSITPASSGLKEILPGRLYGSSILKVARLFWTAPADIRATALSDELRDRPAISAVALVGPEREARGLVRREHLFSMLSKPFGREILGKTPAMELVEDFPRFNAHEGLFAVAELYLGEDADGAEEFCLLVDEEQRFEGVLSSRDLSSYLATMTREDIELAGALQERLLGGNDTASGPGWRLGAWSMAARGVGGDFYFTKRLDDGRLFLALCDVSGKGVAASLVVAMAWGMLMTYDLAKGLPPLIKMLNAALIASFHLEKYLTGFFAFFDSADGSLEAADMGHSHVLIYRDGRAKKPMPGKGNLPVGIEPGLEPSLARWRLNPGDVLLVYSDGLTEQEDAAGVELGEARLAKAGASALARSEPLELALPRLVDLHRGKTPQQDDMTLLALELYAAPR